MTNFNNSRTFVFEVVGISEQGDNKLNYPIRKSGDTEILKDTF